MTLYTVKKFGNGGLHIVLRKKEGHKEGDVVEIKGKAEQSVELERVFRRMLEKYGPEMVRAEVESMQQNRGF
jgi:hypothetical protein